MLAVAVAGALVFHGGDILAEALFGHRGGLAVFGLRTVFDVDPCRDRRVGK